MLVVDAETLAIPDVETYLEPVVAPSNYKDPEKIAAYELEARNRLVERAALDIDLAQILCLGIWGEGYTDPIVKTVDDFTGGERELLDWFVDSMKSEGLPLVTFNGLRYDVPLIMRRCLYLNLPCPQLQVDRFKHPEVVDLAQILSYDGKLDFHSLSFYCNRFGIKTAEQDLDGKSIAQAWLSGNHDAVREKCRIDVANTAALAQRIHALPKAPVLFQTR